MRKIISFILAISIGFAQTSWAYKAVEANPLAVQGLKENGIARPYLYKFPDGAIRKIKIDSYQNNPDGSVTLNYHLVDKIALVDFNEDVFTYEPADDYQPREQEGIAPTSSANWSVGADSAVMAGLQSALITNSKVKRDIERAYEQIEKIQKQMEHVWGQVDSIQIDLENDVINVSSKISGNSSSLRSTLAFVRAVSASDVRLLKGSSDGIENYEWLSPDNDFISRAENIRNSLRSAKVKTSVQKSFKTIAESSLVHADRASFSGDREGAEYLLGIAKVAANVLIGIDPITGFARSLYEVTTGKNMVTGAELSGGERVLAGLGVLTSGYAGTAFKTIKYLMPVAKSVSPGTIKTFGYIKDFLVKTGQEFKLVGDGSVVRKINLRPAKDVEWGLKRAHLEKHFFGEGKLALKNIDPGGTPDKWMQNIADVVQREPQIKHSSGVIDIYQKFEKTDGSGFYKLGVRLSPNSDNSFDLVTVLTDQLRGPKL